MADLASRTAWATVKMVVDHVLEDETSPPLPPFCGEENIAIEKKSLEDGAGQTLPPLPPSCGQENIAIEEDSSEDDLSLNDSYFDESDVILDKFDRLEFDSFNDNLQNEDWIDLKFLDYDGLEGVCIRGNLMKFVEDFKEVSKFAVPKTFVRYVHKLLGLLKDNVCLAYLKEEHLMRAVLHLAAFREESRHLLLPRPTNSFDYEYKKTFDIFVSQIHLLLTQIFRYYPRQAKSLSNASDDFMALYQVFKPIPTCNMRKTWTKLLKTPEEGDMLPAGPFYVCPSTRRPVPCTNEARYPRTKIIPHLERKLDTFLDRLLHERPGTVCVTCPKDRVLAPTDDFYVLVCFHVLCLRCGECLNEEPMACSACNAHTIAWTSNACRVLYRKEQGSAGSGGV